MLQNNKRKYPSVHTIKKLFAYSNNKCYMPDCIVEVFDEDHNLMVDIAHIHGISLKTARYNQTIPEEELADHSNLMLLCRNCHQKVDDKDNGELYSSEKLRFIKAEHESKVSKPLKVDFRLIVQALEQIQDQNDKVFQYLSLEDHKKIPILLVKDIKSLKTWSPHKVKLYRTYSYIGWSLICFSIILILISGYFIKDPSYFKYIFGGVVSSILIGCFNIHFFNASIEASTGKEVKLKNNIFVYMNKDGSIDRYDKMASCPFPLCHGSLRLNEAPPIEAKKFKIKTIAQCNRFSTYHTFIVCPDYLVGSYKEMDFSQPITPKYPS